MVNEAILGALKSGLVRGESLKKAMMTVYNSGYKKEEISEAARSINEEGSLPQTQPIQQATAIPQQPATAQTLAPAKKLSRKEKKSKKSDKLKPQSQVIQQPQALQQVQQQGTPQQVQQPLQQVQQPHGTPQKIQQQAQPIPGQNVVQKVSGYGQPPTTKSKTMIILLGFLLLFLIGILVTIFLFKEELLNFFNNLFS